jgi:hypothetical protein
VPRTRYCFHVLPPVADPARPLIPPSVRVEESRRCRPASGFSVRFVASWSSSVLHASPRSDLFLRAKSCVPASGAAEAVFPCSITHSTLLRLPVLVSAHTVLPSCFDFLLASLSSSCIISLIWSLATAQSPRSILLYVPCSVSRTKGGR